MRVSAQVSGAMSFIGNTSSQWEDLSTMVNRYLMQLVAAGKGPMMSTCRWVKRLAGMAMGCIPEVCCRED